MNTSHIKVYETMTENTIIFGITINYFLVFKFLFYAKIYFLKNNFLLCFITLSEHFNIISILESRFFCYLFKKIFLNNDDL